MTKAAHFKNICCGFVYNDYSDVNGTSWTQAIVFKMDEVTMIDFLWCTISISLISQSYWVKWDWQGCEALCHLFQPSWRPPGLFWTVTLYQPQLSPSQSYLTHGSCKSNTSDRFQVGYSCTAKKICKSPISLVLTYFVVVLWFQVAFWF